MTNLEQLLALGAQCTGGALLWKHKELGRFRDGEFQISDEGREALKIVDVEAKTPDAAIEPPARTRRVRAAPVDVADVDIKIED